MIVNRDWLIITELFGQKLKEIIKKSRVCDQWLLKTWDKTVHFMLFK